MQSARKPSLRRGASSLGQRRLRALAPSRSGGGGGVGGGGTGGGGAGEFNARTALLTVTAAARWRRKAREAMVRVQDENDRRARQRHGGTGYVATAGLQSVVSLEVEDEQRQAEAMVELGFVKPM